MRKNVSGFTIIELLIVIVIIAILAAITLVAYNNVQERALNDQIVAAAKTYKQTFSLYVIQNGRLPPSNNANFCLGHSVTTCTNTAGQVNWTRDTTTLEPALMTIATPLPAPNFPADTYSTSDPNMGYIPYRGGTNSPTLDDVNSAFLIYILSGTTTCPVGPVAAGAWPNFTSANSNQYTYQRAGVTVCWIPLASS